MKKLLILGLIASFAFAEYQRTYINKAQEEKEYKDDRISFTGVIFNTNEYREYIEITIATTEHGRIKTKTSSNRLKEGQRVRGTCSGYEYGIYNNCSIY